MKIIEVNRNSPFLEKVIALGDTARDTVGFLPHEAFMDYAKKDQILACIEGKNLLGYLLFRRGKSVITIVQLCVDKPYRKTGIAKKLVDTLFESCRDIYPTMRLSCRRDYGIDDFWRSLGFAPVGEKSGRATTKNTTLTVWVKTDPNSIDLFTSAALADSKKKIVLDTNILIDLYQGDNKETHSLLQPFLTDYVTYYVSPEALIEINGQDNESIRNSQREFVKQHFEPIQNYDQDIYDSVNADLLNYKNANPQGNTGRDISHIAYAVACGADAFITRDHGWLNNLHSEYIFESYGLRILAPGELVKSIDEILFPNDYAPIQLAGLSLRYAEMTHDQFNVVVEALYREYKEGKKKSFEQDLRTWMAEPQKYHLEITQSNNGIASMVVCSADTSSASSTIHHILTNPKVIKPQWNATFIKRIAFHVIEEAQKRGSSSVDIQKQWLSAEAIKAFEESLFIDLGSILKKYIVSDIMNGATASDSSSGFPRKFILNKLSDNRGAPNTRLVVSLEKVFWPLKIDQEALPCYIVPIKAQYAMDLFDQQLYHTNPCLFENERIEAALSPENVYFKNGRKQISYAPARILWYISEDKSLFGTKMIRACSYLDSIDVDSVDNLYKKYRRYGVLSKTKMRELGSGQKSIVAYLFSYTELFSNPVSLYDARSILGCNQTFQSAVRVSQDKFLQIYKQGREL